MKRRTLIVNGLSYELIILPIIDTWGNDDLCVVYFRHKKYFGRYEMIEPQSEDEIKIIFNHVIRMNTFRVVSQKEFEHYTA